MEFVSMWFLLSLWLDSGDKSMAGMNDPVVIFCSQSSDPEAWYPMLVILIVVNYDLGEVLSSFSNALLFFVERYFESMWVGFHGGSAVIKNPPVIQEMWVWSLGGEDRLEKEMATHSSILAWEISQRSLAGYNPWGHKESDIT